MHISSRTSGIVGIGVPPGSDLKVGNANTMFFAYERRLTPTLSFEITGGIPPTYDTVATGPLAFLGKVSSVKEIAPSLLLNYTFGDEGSALRPFVSVGVNYTHFYDAKSTLGKVQLSDSVGLAGRVGLKYAISKELGLYASFSMADVASNLVATGNTVLTTTIDFRPKVYGAGMFYRF